MVREKILYRRCRTIQSSLFLNSNKKIAPSQISSTSSQNPPKSCYNNIRVEMMCGTKNKQTKECKPPRNDRVLPCAHANKWSSSPSWEAPFRDAKGPEDMRALRWSGPEGEASARQQCGGTWREPAINLIVETHCSHLAYGRHLAT